MTIRLTILMGSFPTRLGGTENLIAGLCPLLAARGVDITIVSRPSPGHPPSTAGATVVHAPTAGGKLRASAAYVRTALATIRASRPHVIHAQSLLSPTTAAIIARRAFGTTVAATIHGGGTGGEIDRLRQLRRGGWARLRVIGASVDRFVVISDEIERELTSVGVPPEQQRHIPNGVDTGRFTPAGPAERARLRASLGLGDDPTAIYVGRLGARKGLETLLEGFQAARVSVPDARLLIVGDGRLRESIEPRAGEGVEFLGSLDDVSGVLQAADVFVLPSLAEGLPLSLLEAMACQLAVISTDVGAARKVVGSAGRIVAPGATDELTTELTRLLSDPALRWRLGSAARERVVAEYDLAGTADQLVALYEELAGRDVG